MSVAARARMGDAATAATTAGGGAITIAPGATAGGGTADDGGGFNVEEAGGEFEDDAGGVEFFAEGRGIDGRTLALMVREQQQTTFRSGGIPSRNENRTN